MNRQEYNRLEIRAKERERNKLVAVLKKLEEKYGLFDPSKTDNVWTRRKAMLAEEIQKKKNTLLIMNRLMAARECKHSPAKTERSDVGKAQERADLEADNKRLRNIKEDLEKRFNVLREGKDHVTDGTRVLLDIRKQIKDNIEEKYKCIKSHEKVVDILDKKCLKLREPYLHCLAIRRELRNRKRAYEDMIARWKRIENKERYLKARVREKEETLQGLNEEIEKCKAECDARHSFVKEVVFVLTDTIRAQYNPQDVERNKTKRQHLMSVLLDILARAKRNNELANNTLQMSRKFHHEI